jgi:signal transduction histidine kinase
MTIRTRLTLWYGSILALTLLAVGALAFVWYAGGLRSSLDEALQVQAADVAGGLAGGEGLRAIHHDPARPGIFTAIFDRTGRLVAASHGVPPGLKPIPAGTTTRVIDGIPYALDAVAASEGRLVVAGSSLAQMEANLARLFDVFLASGVAGLLVSLGGGWILAGRALAPVDRLTSEAEAIRAGELDRRLPEPPRRDELGRLARTLNGMLDRLEEALRRQRAFVAAASHDLRTPLASLQAELELALRLSHPTVDELRDAIRAAHGDAVRLAELAGRLLSLAEVEEDGRQLAVAPVELGELLAGIVRSVTPLAEARGVRVVVHSPTGVVVVDRLRIERAAVNLLSNAIEHGGSGGSVELVASIAGGEKEAPRLVLEVLDRGPGISPDLRSQLFVPFARSATEPGERRGEGRPRGFGLGLATAAAAVRAHRGEIGYRDRPGGGSCFWFAVPLPAREGRPPRPVPRPVAVEGAGSPASVAGRG